MNELRLFKNAEVGKLRTLEIDGEPWFVGKDVAKILGYSNCSKALLDHVDAEDKLNNESLLSLGQRGGWIINESGLYSLILSSKLPSAKKFKHWVTSEVLPIIRKTGAYAPVDHLEPSCPEEVLIKSLEIMKELRFEQSKQKEDMSTLDKSFRDFQKTMPVLPADCDIITKAVNVKTIKALGGYDSSAYRDKSLRGRVYSDIYKELKRQFGVTTYKSLRRNQVDKALEIINAYKLPMALAEEVTNTNNQLNIA